MTYEIKYNNHKAEPIRCSIYPKRLVLGDDPNYKEAQYLLIVSVNHKDIWYPYSIPVKDLLEFNNKSVEEIQIIRPLSNRASSNEYTLDIYLDNQENITSMSMSH
jgi:hypothetical protein